MAKNVEVIVSALEAAGVRWVFGVPSGPVLSLIEALRESPVEFVLTASETSAGFMAAMVGALTGIPGVCVSTVGPGATNLTTGVGCAWLDRAPVIAITCNVASAWLRRRIQMRIDHNALFAPLTKASFSLRHDNVADTMAEAIALSIAEPPGPVHLDLPEDVADALAAPPRSITRDATVARDISGEVAELVGAALSGSRRPLVVTGLSFTRARNAGRLVEFIERHNLPFVSTLHAKGWLPESHPNWCGVIGRARRSDVQRFVDRADLIIGVGFDPIEINYEDWAGSTPIIHIDTEPAEAGPAMNLRANLAGDLERSIEALAALPPSAHEWRSEEFAAQRSLFDRMLRPASKALATHQVLDLLRQRLPPDAILAYDVGAHTHQIAAQWRTDLPSTCLATNGWSSMGFGMPSGYAAKLVHPDRDVVIVVGDGGFQMTAGELALARRLQLTVPTIVLNDGWLGLMKLKQEHRDYPFSGVVLGDPPSSPAHYFGVPCRPAHDLDELAETLEWGLTLGGPSVIEAFVDVEAYATTVFD